jgi:hypothetical protein
MVTVKEAGSAQWVGCALFNGEYEHKHIWQYCSIRISARYLGVSVYFGVIILVSCHLALSQIVFIIYSNSYIFPFI